MEKQTVFIYNTIAQSRVRIILFFLCMSLSLPALAQKPGLSFFTELPSEEMYDLFSDTTVISQLKTLNASLRMGMLDFTPKRAEVVQNLNQHGIPVVAWLLLPKDQGYWFNVENGPAAKQRYEE